MKFLEESRVSFAMNVVEKSIQAVVPVTKYKGK